MCSAKTLLRPLVPPAALALLRRMAHSVVGFSGDYDSWEAQGAPGWGYRDVLPYFINSEDNARGASDYHGVGGPLNVSDPVLRSRLADAMIAAAESLGIPRTDDFNGPQQEGVGYIVPRRT